MRLALPLSLYSEAVGMTLREVIAGCRDRIVSPYLIHSQLQKKGQPMSKDNLSDYFAEARDKAGIKPPEEKHQQHFTNSAPCLNVYIVLRGSTRKLCWVIKYRQPPINIMTHAGRNGSNWSFEWPFFPDHEKNYCKMRGLSDGRSVLHRSLVLVKSFGEILEKRKIEYFQGSENITPSE